MSMQSRTLDRAGRLADELVVDALFIVRRRPWHWPVVIAGLVIGIVLGVVATGVAWFWSPAFALVFGGLGMNVGSDFRFIARTPTRLLLLDSSRVVGLPTRLVRAVPPERVGYSSSGPAMHLDIDGEQHVMARQHVERLQRMLVVPATA